MPFRFKVFMELLITSGHSFLMDCHGVLPPGWSTWYCTLGAILT